MGAEQVVQAVQAVVSMVDSPSVVHRFEAACLFNHFLGNVESGIDPIEPVTVAGSVHAQCSRCRQSRGTPNKPLVSVQTTFL